MDSPILLPFCVMSYPLMGNILATWSSGIKLWRKTTEMMILEKTLCKVAVERGKGDECGSQMLIIIGTNVQCICTKDNREICGIGNTEKLLIHSSLFFSWLYHSSPLGCIWHLVLICTETWFWTIIHFSPHLKILTRRIFIWVNPLASGTSHWLAPKKLIIFI